MREKPPLWSVDPPPKEIRSTRHQEKNVSDKCRRGEKEASQEMRRPQKRGDNTKIGANRQQGGGLQKRYVSEVRKESQKEKSLICLHQICLLVAFTSSGQSFVNLSLSSVYIPPYLIQRSEGRSFSAPRLLLILQLARKPRLACGIDHVVPASGLGKIRYRS
jgi:hypothetical protein